MLQPSFSFRLCRHPVFRVLQEGHRLSNCLSLKEHSGLSSRYTPRYCTQRTKQKQRSAHIQLLAKAGTCCVIRRLHPLHTYMHTRAHTQTLAGPLKDADTRLMEPTADRLWPG